MYAAVDDACADACAGSSQWNPHESTLCQCLFVNALCETGEQSHPVQTGEQSHPVQNLFFCELYAQDHVCIADHSQHMPCHSGPGLWWWQDREANAEGWQGVPQVQGQEEFMAQGKHGSFLYESVPAATAYHCCADFVMQNVNASLQDIGLVFWQASLSERCAQF